MCACITVKLPAERHVVATNEGSAVGLAIGHYLATGRPALVYMQNAGLGNTVNPLTSLADPEVYGIPMILMIGWRGEILADGKQVHDEPQHVKQGQVTLQQLEILGIPYEIIDSQTNEIEPVLNGLITKAFSRSGPVALVVRKQTFSQFKLPEPLVTKEKMSREEAIRIVLSALPDNIPVVATTGKASRELFELRKQSGTGYERDFLTVGGMGHAAQIAAGIALARADLKVACFDGDGAVLMHMGALAISADCPNLLHIVINNGAHDSVGGQPTKGASLDFSRIALACGYDWTSQAETSTEIISAIGHWLANPVSTFLEIKCKLGARADLGRPDRSPSQNKAGFMQFIKAKQTPEEV